MARVLFLQDSGINESLAVADLSAWLKSHGHSTHLLLGEEERDLEGELQAADPNVVIIPCPVGGEQVARGLAAISKVAIPGAKVVMGGTHATFDPGLAREESIDAVIVGEAEGAALEVVERIEAGEPLHDVANVASMWEGELRNNPPRPLIENLDDLPMPDRDLYFRYPFIARFPWKKFATGRGCVHRCAFCWNPNLKAMYGNSTFVRRKSPERAVEEVLQVKRATPLTAVHFSDDLFTIGSRWLEEFAELYPMRVGVPFTANSSVELVTPATVDALAAAGCRGLAIGVETGNERLRSKILKKRVTNDQVREAARLIKGAGLELTTFNMLGSPGERLEDAFDTIRLNREIGADHMRVALAVPMPHSDWEQAAWDAGHLHENYQEQRPNGLSRPTATFKSDDTRAFENLYYLFRIAVRFPRMEPAVRRLLRLPTSKPLDPLRLLNALEERRIFDLGWYEGARFFRHVGDPKRRTANYVTLI